MSSCAIYEAVGCEGQGPRFEPTFPKPLELNSSPEDGLSLRIAKNPAKSVT